MAVAARQSSTRQTAWLQRTPPWCSQLSYSSSTWPDQTRVSPRSPRGVGRWETLGTRLGLACVLASSETQGLLAGRMRYFRVKVYLCSRAQEPLGTYSYRTSSRSGRIPSSWLGRKIFFSPISNEVYRGNSVAFLHEVVFFIEST